MTHTFADDVLPGDGFLLRPPAVTDIDDLHAACQNEDLHRWIILPQPYGRAQAESFVCSYAASLVGTGRGVVRAIDVAGRLCGVVELMEVRWGVRDAQLGYWVAPWGRGQGLAGRAARLLTDWALSTQGLERVEVRAATENAASLAAARRAGFTQEGVARSAGITRAGRVDLAVFSRVRADLEVSPV